MSLRIAFRAIRGEFAEAMEENYRPISEAATKAVRDASDIAKVGARADIASAGFGQKWQNTLRVEAYPKRSAASANAAAIIYHKIPYAGVFEEGATIRGKPRLWIPMSHAPKKIGRKRMSAQNFIREVGRLRMIRKGGTSMLAAKMSVTKKQAKTGRYGRVTVARLRKGVSGNVGARSTVRMVPLFIGVRSVNIRKRFNIADIVQKASAKISSLYMKHLQER